MTTYRQNQPITARREMVFRLATAGGGVLTGQAFAGAEVQLRKAGGAYANAANSGTITELGATGVYILSASAAELDTVGRLVLRVNKAGALLWEEIHEVEQAFFGAAAAGTLTATSFTTTLTNANNVWQDALVRFLTGGLAGQVKKVGSYANAGGLITLAGTLSFSAAPAAADIFELITA